jgi:hypothetical protein
MNLWIIFSGRIVNALIIEEGETFADADVGLRHVVIWGGLLATRLNIVIIDLQVRVGKDVVKRHVGSFPYGCKLSGHMGRQSSNFELFFHTEV